MVASNEELTAWHEAGHAFVAVWLGGQIESVSIDPDYDDGPHRTGDITVRWPGHRFTEQQLRDNAILVALAGPVTEMVRQGDPFHPALVAEWSQDWRLAWQAASFIGDQAKRMRYLESLTVRLYRDLSDEINWAAIGALVDNLLAHETLDDEEVRAAVADWVDVG